MKCQRYICLCRHKSYTRDASPGASSSASAVADRQVKQYRLYMTTRKAAEGYRWLPQEMCVQADDTLVLVQNRSAGIGSRSYQICSCNKLHGVSVDTSAHANSGMVHRCAPAYIRTQQYITLAAAPLSSPCSLCQASPSQDLRTVYSTAGTAPSSCASSSLSSPSSSLSSSLSADSSDSSASSTACAENT